MIAYLKPYAEYKESGLPWLGQIPNHWGLVPNRGLVRRRKVLVGKRHSDYQLLSLTKQGVIVRDISTGRGKFSADMGTSQEVRNGDLVFCLFDVPETPRTVGLSRHDGMITGAYTVLESLGKGNTEYFELFYRAMDDRKLLSPLYSGLRNTIPPERFLGTKTPQPLPAEQAAIVRFLDWATGRLERAIRAKRKVIALLHEQKQAIIHRAVTRGLDPAAPLKDSGIPWLGEIPAYWEVRRLKNVGATQIGLTYSPADLTDDTGCLVLRASNIKDGKLVSTDDVYVRGRIPAKARVKSGDILICARSGSRSLVGKSALIPESFDGVAFGAFMSVFRSSWNDFVFWVLNSNLFRFVMAEFETSTINQLTQGDLNNLVIPVPPRQEQVDIVTHVKEETASLEIAISRLEREIELLREYRTRLVADVVTGKLDVRAAAAALPVEVGSEEIVEQEVTEGEDESDEFDEEIEP